MGFFRQARSDLVFRVQVGLGVVQRGRLGEVGIGVVCKVLSGRQGGVRSDWVRRDLTRFGVAGSVWFGPVRYGEAGFGEVRQVRFGRLRFGSVGCVGVRFGVVCFGRCGECGRSRNGRAFQAGMVR